MVVVWDTSTGTPVKTLFKPHAAGATAMHMCEDASILATVGVDENGTQVMMAWERPYMVRCIDALQITEADSVLEVGFG